MNMIVKYVSVLVGFGVFAFVGNKAIDAFVQNNRNVTTDGIAERDVESDYAKLKIVISNETNVLSEISEKRKTDKKAVIEFLKKQGLDEDEIVENGFSVDDQFRYNEKIEGKKKYKVTDNVIVKTHKVKLIEGMQGTLSELIEKNICIETKAKFFYRDIKKLRLEIIDEATKEAKERAQYLAKSSNMEIGKLKALSVGDFSMLSRDSSATSSSGEYEAEKTVNKKVRAKITATFDLK